MIFGSHVGTMHSFHCRGSEPSASIEFVPAELKVWISMSSGGWHANKWPQQKRLPKLKAKNAHLYDSLAPGEKCFILLTRTHLASVAAVALPWRIWCCEAVGHRTCKTEGNSSSSSNSMGNVVARLPTVPRSEGRPMPSCCQESPPQPGQGKGSPSRPWESAESLGLCVAIFYITEESPSWEK